MIICVYMYICIYVYVYVLIIIDTFFKCLGNIGTDISNGLADPSHSSWAIRGFIPIALELFDTWLTTRSSKIVIDWENDQTDKPGFSIAMSASQLEIPPKKALGPKTGWCKYQESFNPCFENNTGNRQDASLTCTWHNSTKFPRKKKRKP